MRLLQHRRREFLLLSSGVCQMQHDDLGNRDECLQARTVCQGQATERLCNDGSFDDDPAKHTAVRFPIL